MIAAFIAGDIVNGSDSQVVMKRVPLAVDFSSLGAGLMGGRASIRRSYRRPVISPKRLNLIAEAFDSLAFRCG
jgi:hypothetical protein